MDENLDFSILQDQIQAALISTTRIAGQISSEDLPFQRSLNPDLGPSLDEQSERLLALSSALLKSATSLSELTAPVLKETEDVENNWRNVVDVLDSLLEKADTSLDEYTGVIKRIESPAAAQPALSSKKSIGNLGNAFRTQNLVKPQLAFDVKPDNFDDSPWKPLLTAKPYATLPLEESLGTFTNDFDLEQYDYNDFLPLIFHPPITSRPGGLSKHQKRRHNSAKEKFGRMGATRGISDNRFRYRHPYETEILNLKYPDTVYQKSDPIEYQPVDTTSATFVDTLEGVLQMLAELKTAKEIAVDLEHHDARSYVGLVSLMQISIRSKDWIVDTLKPWRQELQILNEVFANPNIIKVFHGAYMDIVWLQRDLGLYIVGLFDTHHASRSLGYAGGSLAFLLKKFIDFDADKKYQLADWRIRPLPEEMFFYARADTHFLLYIYDMMRNELIDKSNPEVPEENRIETVLQKSQETSLLRYERQVYHEGTGKGPGGWYTLLVKTPALFNNEQFAVFRAVHAWRDKIARTDDNSTAFVMPNHVIFTIAKLLPNDMIALLGIAHPISHSVKSRTGELLSLIKSARESGATGPSMMDVLRPDTVGAIAKANIPSVAAAQPSKAATTLVAAIDDSLLRSEDSSFWGDAFGSSIWDAPAAKTDEMRLAVPLPALSSEIFATPPSAPQQAGTGALTDRSREQAMGESVPATPTPKEDEAFVLKRGEKRKNAIMSPAKSSNGDYDISLHETAEVDFETDAKKQKRAEEKAAKKAAKRAKKATGASGDLKMEEEEAFDYSKAESVLHGKKNGGKETKKGGKKGQEPFDPYANSGDAPKGMRRLQTERAGKSHTFKS